MEKKLILSYPSYKVAGAQILVYRLIKECSLRGEEPLLIDYEDGIVSKMLDEEKISYKKIIYKDFEFNLLEKQFSNINLENYIFLTSPAIVTFPILGFLVHIIIS